jgi:hypothetical protein
MKNKTLNNGRANDLYNMLGNVNDIKICDMCGNRIDDGRVYPVKDEQFNIIDGVIQCEDCYRVELGM